MLGSELGGTKPRARCPVRFQLPQLENYGSHPTGSKACRRAIARMKAEAAVVDRCLKTGAEDYRPRPSSGLFGQRSRLLPHGFRSLATNNRAHGPTGRHRSCKPRIRVRFPMSPLFNLIRSCSPAAKAASLQEEERWFESHPSLFHCGVVSAGRNPWL